MDNKLKWIDWIDRLPGAPLDADIAAAAHAAPSTVSRWRKGQEPRPRHCVNIAREYGLHPLTALHAAGFLSVEEIDQIADGNVLEGPLALDSMSTSMLADEVARRLRENSGE